MKRLLIPALIVLLLVGGVAVWLDDSLHEPYAGFREPVTFSIERGAGTLEMAGLLRRHGVLGHEWQFLVVRLFRPKANLQAGEYRFEEPASPWEVFDRIARGDVLRYSVTVPEGSNIFDTAKILARLDWITEKEALNAVRDPTLIRDLDPEAATLEGYLFPSTYHVTRNTPAGSITRIMTRQFRAVWGGIAPEGAKVRETVTLASLIEKETAIPGERSLVSSVYHNRLERGIRLECDPTVIYAAILEGRYRGVIHRSDLASRNRYNTYVHAGLPPGPIASPGRESLRAALEPAQSDYLFFVAKPDGSGAHEFSKTVAEHNRAVGRYRRGIRQKQRQKQTARVSGAKGAGED